jgi:hypothetical protein
MTKIAGYVSLTCANALETLRDAYNHALTMEKANDKAYYEWLAEYSNATSVKGLWAWLMRKIGRTPKPVTTETPETVKAWCDKHYEYEWPRPPAPLHRATWWERELRTLINRHAAISTISDKVDEVLLSMEDLEVIETVERYWVDFKKTTKTITGSGNLVAAPATITGTDTP